MNGKQWTFGVVLLILATPAAYAAETFVIDSEHTHIVWQVERFGFTRTVGTFTEVSGTLEFDAERPENSRVEATIGLAGLRSDLAEREDIVRGPYWLDAAAHPVITFTSNRVARADKEGCEACFEVAGDMTLKGVTAPLILEVKLNKIGMDPVSKRKAAGFSSSGAFKRTDFNIKTAVGPIGELVSFDIEALAIAPGGADDERGDE